MVTTQAIVFNIFFILKLVNNSLQKVYEYALEDEQVFSECQEKLPEYLNIDKLFDFSKWTTTMTEEGVLVGGNLTLWWDIDPKDRIEASCSVSYFDRGSWQSTVLNIKYKDFCVSMFDPKQFWYKFWTKYVVNAEYVMKVCPLPGTTLIVDPYPLNLQFGIDAPLKQGRYKIIILISAVGTDGKVRDQKICTEVRGSILK